MYFFVEAIITLSVIPIDLVAMCRSKKKHEVREANMYFFVEATISLSIMTTDPYNDCSDIFVGLDSGGGPVSPHMVIYLRDSVVVPARWLVALPPPPCAPPPSPRPP